MKTIGKKDEIKTDGIEMEYKFKVVIGTTLSLATNYNDDNPCSSNVPLLKKLNNFYPEQFKASKSDIESIGKAVKIQLIRI